MADLTGQFQVDGLVKQRQELEQLLMSNPDMEKRVQKIIRTVLIEARKKLTADAQSIIKNDPRQAYRAVKTSVYRRILGGSVSILSKRKAGARLPEPPIVHRLETEVNSKGNHRGGNRRPRSRRTVDLMTYGGADRGFILRFLNAGTSGRDTKFGNRGAIGPRNFFSSNSHQAMQQAAAQLERLIGEMIAKELK